MVDRAKVLAQISALLDNELPEEEALAIKKHLLSCHRCRTEFEKLKKIDYLLNEWDRQATELIKTSNSYQDRLCLRIRSIRNNSVPSRRHQNNTDPTVAKLKTANHVPFVSHSAAHSSRFDPACSPWELMIEIPSLAVHL
ncbi:MAG: zf-HC2 domain-containing protein [Candidatus Glassbacteria bacterium]|nr:zf-HC2 domain-containing protein [Candidatus Glassbacteria bacterium]